MKTTASRDLYRRAERVMVGGVSSPVRAFKAVGGEPLFITRGKGSKIWDADGTPYVDYVCSWGPLILGHSHPAILKAVLGAVKRGTSFGAPTLPELRLAEVVCASVPSIEKVRFVSSGTEATMSALRLARAYTSRTKLVKFDGCYHGHADPFLTQAGSGLATLDIPSSGGLSPNLASESITIPYNDPSSLERTFGAQGKEIAAVIVEPIAGNMGVVKPEPGFLRTLRRLCDESGSLLIFDEVITGFRVSKGGAQELYDVRPDITCLGKIIGGGFPVGAYGARREIMRLVAPEGTVYQAGTLSGNPIAMTAGLVTISRLKDRIYARLEALSSRLERGLREQAASAGVSVSLNRVGSMIGLFFTSQRVKNFADAKGSEYRRYATFHRAMLKGGVYLPASAFETIFLSSAHSNADVDGTINIAGRAFREMARESS